MGKLLKDKDNIALFANSEDIIIDKNLLKYKKLGEVKKKQQDDSSKNVQTQQVGIDSYDPDALIDIQQNNYTISSSSGIFTLDDDARKRALDTINGMKNARDVMFNNNAEKFNIIISERLKKLMVDKSRISIQFLNSATGEIKSMNPSYIIKDDNNEKLSFKEKIAKSINKWLFNKKQENKDKENTEEGKKIYKFSVLDIFDQVKIISGKEREFADRVNSYLSLIHKANDLHQEAQVEILLTKLVIHIYESVLAVSGFNHYITFKDLISLQLNCKKQLNLDYIRNFTRVIPDEVYEKKIIADNLLVFDNYVILHYDPEGKSFSLTDEEEKIIKKDPILFGVINGSEKLYYIADWIDDYCDLTLDQVIEKLGEDKLL